MSFEDKIIILIKNQL